MIRARHILPAVFLPYIEAQRGGERSPDVEELDLEISPETPSPFWLYSRLDRKIGSFPFSDVMIANGPTLSLLREGDGCLHSSEFCKVL